MPGSLRVLFAFILVLSAGALAGCDDDPTGSTPPPTISDAYVRANPHNVVSAVVVVRTRNAAEVSVAFSEDSTFSRSTPAVAVSGDSTIVPVLELKPGTTYRMRVTVRSGGGGQTVGAAMQFTTGPLPGDIPSFKVPVNNAPAPGYVLFGITAGDTSLGGFYALAVNNQGNIVWYRKFTTQVTDLQRQPNGSYTVFGGLDDGIRQFMEMDALGNILRTYAASGGIETGAHELRLRNDGYVLFGVRDSVMDLSTVGGNASAKVRGIMVEYHRTAGGSLLWSSYDHLDVTEAASDIPLAAAGVNPWHGNAIDVDTDGNLLVSFRNSDMIVKVDSHTGQVLWRLGGKRNQFTFVGDALNGFSHQHGVRRLPNGNIILFDNGNLHTPAESRAVEYRLDETAKRAELVWEHRHNPLLYSFALGYADRAPNGNTLICYGINGRLVEVDASGATRWELALDRPEYFIYRAFRIASLY